jgi:hypothetical protein
MNYAICANHYCLINEPSSIISNEQWWLNLEHLENFQAYIA